MLYAGRRGILRCEAAGDGRKAFYDTPFAKSRGAYKRDEREPKVLTPICAREGADPRYVLVAAKKDAKPGLKFNYPLVIYDKNGEYTQQMDKIYHREKENE